MAATSCLGRAEHAVAGVALVGWVLVSSSPFFSEMVNEEGFIRETAKAKLQRRKPGFFEMAEVGTAVGSVHTSFP